MGDRTIKKSTYLILLSLLVNSWMYIGFVRLYLFPSYAKLLYFIPFGLTLALAVYSLANSQVAIRKNLFFLPLIYLGVFFQGIHIFQNHIDLKIAVYGLLLYCFPFFLFIGTPFYGHLRLAEKLEKQILLGIYPNLILSFLQTYVPNSKYATSLEDTNQLVSSSGYVRAFGTFSSTTGFSYYLALATCLMIFNSTKKSKRLYLINWIAILSMFAMSGSRTAILTGGLIILTGFIVQKNRFARVIRKLPVMFLASIPIAVLLSTILRGPVEALLIRFQVASTQENSFLRVWQTLTGFSQRDDSSLFGTGLGSYSTGSVGYVSTGQWIEQDLARTIVEAGSLVGFCLVLARWILCCFLIYIAKAQIRDDLVEVPLLVITVLPNILYGQLVGQGSIAVGSWLTIFLIFLRRSRTENIDKTN